MPFPLMLENGANSLFQRSIRDASELLDRDGLAYSRFEGFEGVMTGCFDGADSHEYHSLALSFIE